MSSGLQFVTRQMQHTAMLSKKLLMVFVNELHQSEKQIQVFHFQGKKKKKHQTC